MRYGKVLRGTFLERPNRFLARVEIQGREELCHVKNTGRCRELLVSGAEVYVEESENPGRKTKYDLIAVYKGGMLVNMDSQIPNAVVEEWIQKGNLLKNVAILKRETVFGNSRFDLYAEFGESRRAFLEVKGVTLEQEGIARFPDAPTLRGIKHVDELCRCAAEGYDAYLIFVIQMKGVTSFEPNRATHPEFGDALIRARAAGVRILAADCMVTPTSISLDRQIPVYL